MERKDTPPEDPTAAQDEEALTRVDREDLPDTEATPETDVATTDAAITEGPPDSSGAIDQDAPDNAPDQ